MGWFDVTWDQCGQWRAEMNGKIDWLGTEGGKLKAEMERIRGIVEGDGNEWGLVQHVHGTGPDQKGLWGSVDILKASLKEAQEKNRALEARLDSLQEKYEKLSKLLIEAARKHLSDK